ncbi:hypothetical protein QBC44DRAFT_332107 [Cladorrhinum sp. PSN332]|nr:hypothetical protein QBC44DRAFT_332107 [Cladorrhinum sp. PSN332]
MKTKTKTETIITLLFCFTFSMSSNRVMITSRGWKSSRRAARMVHLRNSNSNGNSNNNSNKPIVMLSGRLFHYHRNSDTGTLG